MDFPLIFFFFFFFLGFHYYGVAMMVGCCCGGEVEGVGLWGSLWWRSKFVDRHGGGCGFVVIGICVGHRRLWWSMEAMGCGRGLCSQCGSRLWLTMVVG